MNRIVPGTVLAAVVGIAASASMLTRAEDATTEVLEEIFVTGSYIRGTPEDAASPVELISRDDILASGVTDIAEIARNLDIAAGSDTAPSDGNRFNGSSGAGLSNISLRGLGPTATLVLLDGKRLPFAGQKISNGDRFVDINAIPITMVERVEVLKTGASATYGSDAIAGVVNFITRKDFEGFELSGKFQSVTEGSQDDATLGAVFGWASEDQRTHFVIGGEYLDRSLFEASDRPGLRNELFPRQDGEIVNRFTFTGADPACEAQGFFVNNGENSDPNVCERSAIDTDLIFPDQRRESVMATAYHQFSESLELYGQASYMRGRSGSNRPSLDGPIEPKFFFPSLLGSTSAAPFPVDPTNPFVGGAPGDPSLLANGGPLPPGPIPGVIAFPLELTDFTLRVPGLEPTRNYKEQLESTTLRFQAGVRGDFTIADRPWNYDLSFTRGENTYRIDALGIDKDRLELATYGLGGPNCTPNGTIDPTDPRGAAARFVLSGTDGQFDDTVLTPGAVGPLEPTLLALMGTVPNFPFINPDNLLLAMTSNNNGDLSQGCQFYNPFLSRANPAQANSEELLNWLEVELDDYQRTDTFLNVVDFVVAGDAFELGGRPVALALGAQYREEGRKTQVHPQITGSVNSFGQLSGGETVGGLSENLNFDATRDVWAVFAEVALPITETLDVQIAGRFEDYGGGIGSTFDPKIAARWQATDDLVLRAGISSAFRGPALAQIEEGTGFSLEFGVRDVLGEGTDPAGPNCVRTGRCALPDPNAAPVITIVKQGLPSPTLEPETAVSWNVGAIWSPQDGPLQGLTFGIDYYSFDFEDKIIDVPTQAFLFEELGLFQAALAANDFTIVNPNLANFGQACDPNLAIYNPGAVESESCQVNPGAYSVSGGQSQFDGDITRRADTSRDLQIIASNAINTGAVETSGIDFSLSYQFEGLGATWLLDGSMSWIHKFEVKDFPVGQPDFDAAGFTNRGPTRRLVESLPDLKGNLGLNWFYRNHTARVGMRFIGAYTDDSLPALRLEDEFDPYFAFDLNYTYTVDLKSGGLTLSAGAIDLFDADLPNVRDGRGTDLLVFDQRGRRLFLSATYRL